MSFTNYTRHDTNIILKRHDYNLDRTLRVEWSNLWKTERALRLESIFEKYCNKETDEIDIDGTVVYFQDLGVDLADPVGLAIAEQLESPAEGRFTRIGFVLGWNKADVTSVPDMQQAVEKMKTMMKTDKAYFKKVYRFTFMYILPERARSLPSETAVAYWGLLLGDGDRIDPDILQEWTDFVQQVYKKNISKDTWNMILEFAEYLTEDPQLENYDLEGSWPSIIDEFVEHMRNKGKFPDPNKK